MINITTVENAINRWRERFPSDPVTCAVCPQVDVLGDLYASMIYFNRAEVAEQDLSDLQRDAIAMAH